ncbi:membrane protein [Gemmatimonadetes bacterium T265]|nr:membrane protein [Gemmatimonadetes bacterium T265]
MAGCTLAFLSCVGVLQDFSAYQSDGMLLEAGFLSCFVAPRGLRPGLGAADPPPRFGLFLLQWEWFRIYFESGVVKLASGDVRWRDLTAMDRYYETGPMPAWPGWYVQHLPHWYHAGTVLVTLGFELVLVWALFLGRRARAACFLAVTALQVGIIATANYAFLNYLVLALGVLLLDDRTLARVVRGPDVTPPDVPPTWRDRARAGVLAWAFVATLEPVLPAALRLPARTLAPFRVANTYGLFAVMTDAEYEIEFQGTRDGRTWTAYPFRYKPQDPREAPGIYAPYQPRFDWNLWFASLGPWQDAPWVLLAQARLLEGSPDVLALFRGNPFPGAPPTAVRTVRWRYWFTDAATRRATGRWWDRELLGPYAGTLARAADGRIVRLDAPQARFE